MTRYISESLGSMHKATTFTESKAAVAGGVKAFYEMPNTVPTCLTSSVDNMLLPQHPRLPIIHFIWVPAMIIIEEVLQTNDKKMMSVESKHLWGSIPLAIYWLIILLISWKSIL